MLRRSPEARERAGRWRTSARPRPIRSVAIAHVATVIACTSTGGTFTDNADPGVMLPSAARSHLGGY